MVLRRLSTLKMYFGSVQSFLSYPVRRHTELYRHIGVDKLTHLQNFLNLVGRNIIDLIVLFQVTRCKSVPKVGQIGPAILNMWANISTEINMFRHMIKMHKSALQGQ